MRGPFCPKRVNDSSLETASRQVVKGNLLILRFKNHKLFFLSFHSQPCVIVITTSRTFLFLCDVIIVETNRKLYSLVFHYIVITMHGRRQEANAKFSQNYA